MTRLAQAALVVLLACARPAPADNVSWTGSSNNWGNAASWTPHAPTSLDDAFLGVNGGGNYTVTYTNSGTNTVRSVNMNASNATFTQNAGGGSFTLTDANVTAGTFNQFSGSLNVGNITVTGGMFAVNGGTATLSGAATVGGTGVFNLSGGTLIGGTLTVNNAGGFVFGLGTLRTATTVNNGGALNGGNKFLGNGGDLTLAGGTTTFSAGTLRYNGTGSVTVGNGATLAITGDIDIDRDAGYAGPAPFTIQAGGVVHKTGGGGVAQFHPNLTITNAGTLRTSSNVLELDSSVTNSGVLRADAGATLRMVAGTMTLNGGSSITGAGTFQLIGGTSTAAVIDVQANTTAAAGGTVLLEVGTVQGNSTLTVNGTLSWKEAVIGGTSAATVRATNGGVINGNAHVSTGTMVLNAGTFSWTNSDIDFDGSGKLQIDAGATLSLAGDRGFVRTAGAPILQIDGTFEKASGAGGTAMSAGLTVNNTGLVRVLTGRVEVGGTLNNTGTVHVASGAEFRVNGSGVTNFNAGSNVTGTGGMMRLDGSSAVINLNNTAVSSDGGLTFFNGTINGTGVGALNLSGPFNFGVFSGGVAGGTINAAGGGDWTNTGTRQINGGAVNLTGGTTTMLNTNVSFGGSGALTVGPSGTLDLTGNGSILRTAGSPTFTVNGVFQKSGGTGTSTIAAGITTTIGAGGLVDVSSGFLRILSTTANNGTLRASTGGQLRFESPIALTGTGLVDVAGGEVEVNLTGTQSIPAGMTVTNAGTIRAASGTLSIPTTATLTNFAANTLTGGTWQALGGTINLGGRTVQTLAAGTTVELSGAGQLVGLASLTQNNGQLRIISGTTNVSGTVNNAGLMQVSGTLNGFVTVQSGGGLGGNGTVNGNVTVQSGGLVSPGPGPYTFPGTGQFSLGATALNGGSEYVWELSSWSTTPSAGSDFDQIRGGTSGVKLNLAGASSGNRITLRVVSLSGGLPGLISGFDPETLRSWVIADYSNGNATGGILNFSADKFTIDTGLFGNDPGTGQFSIGLDGTGSRLVLTYNPVPEPASVLLVAAAALGFCRLRRSEATP